MTNMIFSPEKLFREFRSSTLGSSFAGCNKFREPAFWILNSRLKRSWLFSKKKYIFYDVEEGEKKHIFSDWPKFP